MRSKNDESGPAGPLWFVLMLATACVSEPGDGGPESAQPPQPVASAPAERGAGLGADPAPHDNDNIQAQGGTLGSNRHTSGIDAAKTEEDEEKLAEPGPLYRWMKAAMLSSVRTKNFSALEEGFAKLEKSPHSDFSRWGEYATEGRIAAAAGDERTVRKLCKICHSDYRKPYRRRMRQASFP